MAEKSRTKREKMQIVESTTAPISVEKDVLKLSEISLGTFAHRQRVYMVIKNTRDETQMVVPAELIYKMVEVLNSDFAGSQIPNSRYFN